jgi:hypothetical protein
VLEACILAGALERFADRLKEESDGEEDVRRRAYKSGKADGLLFAGKLLLESRWNGYSRQVNAQQTPPGSIQVGPCPPSSPALSHPDPRTALVEAD